MCQVCVLCQYFTRSGYLCTYLSCKWTWCFTTYFTAPVEWNLSTSCKMSCLKSATHTGPAQVKHSGSPYNHSAGVFTLCVCVFTLLKRRPRWTETSPVEIYSVTAVFPSANTPQTTAQVCVNIPIHNLLGARIAFPKHRLPHTHFLRLLYSDKNVCN